MSEFSKLTPFSQSVVAVLKSDNKTRIAFLDDGVAIIDVRPCASRQMTVVSMQTNCLSKEKVIDLASSQLGLSERQAVAAYLSASGVDVQTLATKMQISANTARRHIEAVYVRLKVSSRTGVERILAHMVEPHLEGGAQVWPHNPSSMVPT